jgi:peptide/nickel transport system permease protein
MNAGGTDSVREGRQSGMTRRDYMRLYRKASRSVEMWEIFRSNRLAMVGLVVFVLVVILALLADFVSDYDLAVKTNIANRLQGPSKEHWFGTDELGRDLFARVAYGARISLRIGISAILVAVALSLVVGGVAGYFGGWFDNFIMRFVDIITCLPSMVLAIAIVAAFGSSELNIIMAIGISRVPFLSRVVRSAVLAVRDMDYVEAARAMGQSTARIIFSHVLPNCISPIMVQATLQVASNITTVSSLSFLGMGVAPPAPEWGSMISNARSWMRLHPHLVVAPGLAIFLATFSFNLLGDGLRDALDPKLKQ